MSVCVCFLCTNVCVRNVRARKRRDGIDSQREAKREDRQSENERQGKGVGKYREANKGHYCNTMSL